MSKVTMQINLRIEPELHAGLMDVKGRDHISVNEQARQAITQWLQQKGVCDKKEE